MKLRNGFYRIEQQDETPEGLCFRLKLDPQHTIYRAHFPGNPITPGVCIIQMVAELLEITAGCPLELRRVGNVKFLNVLSPVEHPEAEVLFRSREHADGQWKIKAVVRCGEVTFAQLSMILEDGGDEQ